MFKTRRVGGRKRDVKFDFTPDESEIPIWRIYETRDRSHRAVSPLFRYLSLPLRCARDLEIYNRINERSTHPERDPSQTGIRLICATLSEISGPKVRQRRSPPPFRNDEISWSFEQRASPKSRTPTISRVILIPFRQTIPPRLHEYG